MSLPVSQYEALLAQVRDLRREAQHVQQLAKPLLASTTISHENDKYKSPAMEQLVVQRRNLHSTDCAGSSMEGEITGSEDEFAVKGTHLSVSSEPIPQLNRAVNDLYHGTWPVERTTMWNSEPTSLGPAQQHNNINQSDMTSVISFASSSGGVPLDRVLGSPDRSRRSSQQLEAKVDMVYSLLAMLGGQEHADMSETLLALSTNPESCLAMRQSGCIPLLVQLAQSDRDSETRKKASQALYNLVHAQPDEKLRKKETRILKLLDLMRLYTEALRSNIDFIGEPSTSEDGDKHPVQTVAHIMKLSFDEGHRQVICQLGGIHTIASLIEIEHSKHDNTSNESQCVLLRRYACMALTNLTFGDSGNKALLCSFRDFIRALVVQLQSPSDELRQVTASVLRNLSWRADSTSKEILKDVGSVTGLMKAAMLDNKENTLKSILSALWNLSAHSTENKSEICAVEGALGFLVDMLTYKSSSKSLAIIENSGGILRNISSQIAVRDDYREILREHNCLQILLDQLKSPSLTIVGNACGTLWNLSAKNATDQELLWQLGAPAMLRSLNHSKHKMIAMGSSAALKNLISVRPSQAVVPQMDSTALSMDLPALPTLGARKQKALLKDLDSSLSETYENIEKDSPVHENLNKSIPNQHIQRDNGSTYLKRPEFASAEKITASFSSLTITDQKPSASYDKNAIEKSQVPQSSGNSSSLPYMGAGPSSRKTRKICTYIPVRSKFSDSNYEDELESSEQPVNFSQKYPEIKVPTNVAKATNKSSYKFETGKKTPRGGSRTYDIYAETDLDQPTDYSLRYAEDSSDSDSNKASEYVQDSVKTYCTEGTPYETPFNFSTSTSMSDLRLDDKLPISNDKILTDKKSTTFKENSSTNDEKDHCSTEDISEVDGRAKPLKAEFNFGIMSPEKPINYCEEGTPGYFSRRSSFGSLNSLPVNDSTSANEQQNKTISKTDVTSKKMQESKDTEKVCQKLPSEAKAVKFGRNVNYAEETPLMFSRSSSLASLDSIEQHSIHDDRSSVVSDFSRLNSGVVSPSELPDSPTQTVPPSPRPRKNQLEYPSSSSSSRHKVLSENKPQPAVRTRQKASVFEDNVTKFKEESTPLQFSTATSLSSLTIEESEEPLAQASFSQANTVDLSPPKEEPSEKQDIGREKETSSSDINEDLNNSEDEADEDMLAACINDGMQSNRHTQQCSAVSKLPLTSYKYQLQKTSLIGRISGLQIPRSTSRNSTKTSTTINKPVRSDLTTDTVQTYFTEDTPAILSHAGSNSDLSALSTPDTKHSRKDYLSDDSSNLSGDNDNILAECIQSGMPKAKKEPGQSSASTSSLPRRQKVMGPTSKSEVRKTTATRDASLPVYLTAKDEMANYEVENSPLQFSLGSSLSDLTADSSVAGLKKYSPNKSRPGVVNEHLNSKPGTSSHQQGVLNISEENNLVHPKESSYNESLSSISIESLGSLETEQALLEQCISSGMPKSKHNVTPSRSAEKPQNLNIPKKELEKEVEQTDKDKSKNDDVASVARNTIRERPDIPATAAGVKNIPIDNDKAENVEKLVVETIIVQESKTNNLCRSHHQLDTSRDKCWRTEENLSTELMKSGSNKSLGRMLESFSPEHSEISNSDNNCNNKKPSLNSDFDFGDQIACSSRQEKYTCDQRLERSCEENGKILDTRMLDPEAMIESLDRFTAELVSQASSHLQNNYVLSTNDNTWDDNTSPNEITFPSVSGSAPNVITFNSDENNSLNTSYKLEQDVVDATNDLEHASNDFSSVNTSTMSESTIIAMEATRMASAFKKEAEMSISATSFDLESTQPPSHFNSLTNSIENGITRSPKMSSRKKPLPSSIMVRRALNYPLTHAASVESVSKLDNINPPSLLGEVMDMEGSNVSIASLPSDGSESKPNFLINGPVTAKETNKNNLKQPSIMHLLSNSGVQSNSICDLDNMNPPSLLNEITDMCNSLADVATSAICSETEVFEDCFTHIVDNTWQTDNDVTEFSDANSITPLQSDDSSSADSTPKKSNSVAKQLTSKQKRQLAKDRYKTYTVAAEMVLFEEDQSKRISEVTLTDYQTAECFSSNTKTEQGDDTLTYMSPTYTINTSSPCSPKPTPRERRQNDRSRFQTQVLDVGSLQTQTKETPTENCQSSNLSPQSSPKVKSNARRHFMQNRLMNRDRFKTRVIDDPTISPDLSSQSPCSSPVVICGDANLHLEEEAKKVLQSLREAKTTHDEFLDCETLSLVSNEDESELNSVGSVNCRTYHKSWGFRQQNMPIIPAKSNGAETVTTVTDLLTNGTVESGEPASDPELHDECEGVEKLQAKPKIVKPGEEKVEEANEEEQRKAIRGRRKPLYAKTSFNKSAVPKSVKPLRSATSNLVKNVTSSLKAGTALKSVVSKTTKITAKPPQPPQTKTSSGYGAKIPSSTTSPKTSPARKATSVANKSNTTPPPSLERQGTFTKSDSSPSPPTSRSRIPAPSTKFQANTKILPNSRIPASRSVPRTGITKSATTIMSPSKTVKVYNRSTSADSREAGTSRTAMQNSSSNHSLKSDPGKVQNGVAKRILPNSLQSNSRPTSTGELATKKQVTSKIASLWKKIEQSKKQPQAKDSRVWIQADQTSPQHSVSHTSNNENKVVLRNKPKTEEVNDDGTPKRISRLGSFIVMDDNEDNLRFEQF